MEQPKDGGGEAPQAMELRRAELRLECLRLALVRTGANDPRPWRAIAEELYGWLTAGRGERGGGESPAAVAPTAMRGKARAAVPRRRSGQRA